MTKAGFNARLSLEIASAVFGGFAAKVTAVGRFLNKGNQKFAEFSRTKYFIDKTELLNVLLEKDVDEKFICCSRPRRFGKSVTADMMTAYFSRGVDSRSMDEDSTAGLVQQVHSDFISSIEYNDENSLVCTITVALLAFFRYYHRPMREFPRDFQGESPLGKGFADIVYLPLAKCPNRPVVVVELKWNQDTQAAITQIKERAYPESLQDYSGEILLVGIT